MSNLFRNHCPVETGIDVQFTPDFARKRFYRIEVAPGLFGPLIIRAWGRIGCKVRVIVDNFGSLVDALNEANRLYRSKKKKGYSDVGSIVGGKIPVSPRRFGKVRIRRVGKGEPTLPGLDLC